MKIQTHKIMSKPRFEMGFDFDRKPEKVDPTSYTIPDDSYTIEDLFLRNQKGAPLPIGLDRSITYGDEPSHTDPDLSYVQRLDPVDLQNVLDRTTALQASLQERLKALQEDAIKDDPKADPATPDASKGKQKAKDDKSKGGENPPSSTDPT